MLHTLHYWQKLIKLPDGILCQASSKDGKDTWQPFPIGMGHHWQRFRNDTKIQLGPHDQLLYVALNPTSDKGRRKKEPINRQTIVATLAKRGFYNNFTSPQDYFYSLPKYKFVASPEGNGIDCHRHFEAILAGAIPIVEDRPEMRQKYEGLPILWTRDYSEITKSYLIKTYETMLQQTFDFSKLFLSSYTEEEQKTILECSEFWLKKLG